jgi:hypothetical protein
VFNTDDEQTPVETTEQVEEPQDEPTDEDESFITVAPAPRRGRRERRAPALYDEEERLALRVDYLPHTEIKTPRTY